MAKIILANDGIAASAKAILEEKGYVVDTNHYQGDDLVNRLKEVDCIVVRSATKIRETLIDKVCDSNLKLIIRAGVGVDNIDVMYAESKGLIVRNTPNSSSASVAELAIGSMFTLARHIHIANVTMRKGQWNKKQYKGTEINGKTLGLIGFGRIAREVAKRALALGMKVNYFDMAGTSDLMPECQYVEFDQLLASSDYISLHIPYIKSVGAVLNKEAFSKMKDGVYIIHTARGGVVCEDSLIEALDSGKVAGAALDVFEEEPTKNERIYTHDKISLTPHIGGSTSEAQDRIGLETIAVIEECI
jgi:D-3-phosphoglycerate dehydrogenase